MNPSIRRVENTINIAINGLTAENPPLLPKRVTAVVVLMLPDDFVDDGVRVGDML